MIIRSDDDYFYEMPPWGFGSTHSISSDPPERDIVTELHQVIEEVTGKPVIQPARKIGFY